MGQARVRLDRQQWSSQGRGQAWGWEEARWVPEGRLPGLERSVKTLQWLQTQP